MYKVNSAGVVLNPEKEILFQVDKMNYIEIEYAKKDGVLYGVLALSANDRGFSRPLQFEKCNIVKNKAEILEKSRKYIIEFMRGCKEKGKKLIKNMEENILF